MGAFVGGIVEETRDLKWAYFYAAERVRVSNGGVRAVDGRQAGTSPVICEKCIGAGEGAQLSVDVCIEVRL